MTKQYFAKSILSNGKQPTVKDHLQAVSELAKQYGAEINMAAPAELAGILHDFGKYSDRFQDVLAGNPSRINHAICGAVLLNAVGQGSYGFHKIIEAICAHHSALASYEALRPILECLWKESLPREFDGKEAALTGAEDYKQAYKLFRQDFPAFQLTSEQRIKTHYSDKRDTATNNLISMLQTRMLFSCLVDADYTASATEEDETYPEQSERSENDYSPAIHSLAEYRTKLSAESTADAELNAMRNAVFNACSDAALQNPGLFTLTAPTGTGKTLALLQFALQHCVQWGKQRIILVLPFLSLTEQSAATYRNILPDLFEDTSQSELSDEARLYTSRWRVPFIVTTSVKFFQSLFADHPSECRRLHNIANSVIVFDEAQTLSPELTRFTLYAIQSLIQDYGCTMLLSTATQPDYSAISTLSQWKPQEILPDSSKYYARLKRTELTWRIREKDQISWESLAQELLSQTSVCTIVNLRKHARLLYQALRTLCAEEEIFFLTTDLCPAHRSQVIAAIRERLDHRLPCRVISTQCIEAGVDLDFDAVYRALAPLDSIIQAAGRCNRNGRLQDLGKVVIFRPEDEGYPGNWYRNAAETVRRLCAVHPIDIHDPEEIRRYYREIFSHLKDKPALKDAIQRQDYHAVAQEYQIIEKQQSAQIIVPFEGMLELYNQIVNDLKNDGITPALVRKAAPITVSCYIDNRLETIAEQVPYRKKGEGMSPFYYLRRDFLNCYTSDMGLLVPEFPKIEAIL